MLDDSSEADEERRLEAERQERERLAQLELERLEQECLAQLERERLEQERLAAIERERLAALEMERVRVVAGRELLDKKRIELIAAEKEYQRRVELFVFRQDNCPHCPTLEKHLSTFATKYGFKVEAVSPDHSQSQYYKTYTSPELIEGLGLKIMPTVIAVVNESRQRFELVRGGVSVVDIEEKALLLAKHLGLEIAANYAAEPKNRNQWQ